MHVSPRRFGGGPIRLIVSNQTGRAQALTLATGGRAAGVTGTTAPIAPRGATTLEMDVPEGSYEISAGDLRPAAVRWARRGPRRRTSCCSRRR